MMLRSLSSASMVILVVLLRFASIAAAGSHETTRCYTVLATTAASYHTSWTTHLKACASTVTVTVGFTPTKSVSTATISTTTTTTLAASPSFQPVQDTIPGSSYDGRAGGDPVHKRDVEDGPMLVMRGTKSSNKPVGKLAGQERYAKGVSCHRWKQGKCSTVTKTVTSTVAPAKPTTTLTSTSTVYAACATNNIADFYLGQPISSIGFTVPLDEDTMTGVLQTNTTGAYDCCVASFTLPPNRSQAYIFTGSAAGNCYILYASSNDVCANGQASASFTTFQSASGTYAVGNGYCGEFIPSTS
nr:hypothetical protein CFP56_41359 [Quercus suber]